MYYESLEEAISTADHAIVNCIFTFDLNKQDNPKDYKTNNVQRRLLAAVHNAFEYESYRKQCYLKRVQKNIIEWECKIVCVNRYCMNLLYAPYWGKQR